MRSSPISILLRERLMCFIKVSHLVFVSIKLRFLVWMRKFFFAVALIYSTVLLKKYCKPEKVVLLHD